MESQLTQLKFLKGLILQGNWEENRRLHGRIVLAEEQEQRSRLCTIYIASGIASCWMAVALVTEGWSWVLRESGHPVAVGLLWLAGIALFSLLLVGGCWLWHRKALRRTIRETQRFVAGWLASRDRFGAGVERRSVGLPFSRVALAESPAYPQRAANDPGHRRIRSEECRRRRRGPDQLPDRDPGRRFTPLD